LAETALQLLAREGSFILVLAALGSGLAALIPGQLPVAARIAFAPALGVAAGGAVLLTASQAMSMSAAVWLVVVPLCVVSVAVAVWRARGSGAAARETPSRLDVLCLAAALVIPLALFSAPLVDQRSLGPAANFVADAPTYAFLNDRLEDNSWNDSDFGVDGYQDRVFRAYLHTPLFQTGTGPMGAALDATFGWESVHAQSSLMIALAAIGALGCFGLVLAATGSRAGGVLAAALASGPVTYQLFVDGSEAALAGLALIGPATVVAARLTTAPVRAGALLGILAAGLMTLYPPFLPLLTAAVGLGLGIHALRQRASRGAIRTVAVAAGVSALVAIVIAPAALGYNVTYVREVSQGLLEEPVSGLFGEAVVVETYGRPIPPTPAVEGFPQTALPASAVPSWLAGSRERYYLPPLGDGSLAGWLLLGLVVPAVVFGFAAWGAIRFAVLRLLLLVVPAVLALTAYSYEVRDCAYCGQRPLVILGPLLACLAAGGLVAAAAALGRLVGRRGAALAAVAVALAGVGIAVQKDSVLARRLIQAGYVHPSELRTVLDAIPGRGAVAVDGTAAGKLVETQLLLGGVFYETGSYPSYDARSLYASIFFPDRPRAEDDFVDPGYEWVLTRHAALGTPRETLVRSGPYALQRRTTPLDVTVTYGAITDLPQRDPSGDAWVRGPLGFTVAGRGRGSLSVELDGPSVATLEVPPGAATAGRTESSVTVCVPLRGGGDVRFVPLPLEFEPLPETPSPDPYSDVPVPGKGLRLAAVAALPERCEGPRPTGAET